MGTFSNPEDHVDLTPIEELLKQPTPAEEKLDELKEMIEKLQQNDEKIIELIERGKIRLDAHISKILDRVDLGQDSYDTILKLLLDYGKKKDLRK